jgi:NAD+ kinase
MPEPDHSTTTADRTLTYIGLVVHPVRDVSKPLDALEHWARDREIKVVSVSVPGQGPQHLEQRGAEECDLVVAIGGDGTTLAATRAAADAGCPVLGVACGSLGALTAVSAGDVEAALARYADGDWEARALPALAVTVPEGDGFRAFNDVIVIRDGDGQVRTTATVDGALFARLAGDGVIVSTPVGSSAYTIAARGPLLAPGLEAIALTPLPTHGGFCPPLVVGAQSQIELDIKASHGGFRLEVDGRTWDTRPQKLAITLECEAATVVGFPGAESHLTGLRDRGIVLDSPRIVAEDRREQRDAGGAGGAGSGPDGRG